MGRGWAHKEKTESQTAGYESSCQCGETERATLGEGGSEGEGRREVGGGRDRWREGEERAREGESESAQYCTEVAVLLESSPWRCSEQQAASTAALP